MFVCRRPAPPLSHFVEMLWIARSDALPLRKERVLPTGCAGLIVNLAQDQVRTYDREDRERCRALPGAVVAGACSEYCVIDTAEQTWVAGVQFRAGGAFPFFASRPASSGTRTLRWKRCGVWLAATCAGVCSKPGIRKPCST